MERIRPEPQPEQPTRTKTFDDLYMFRGTFTDDGICRLRIYQGADEDNPPVIIFTELNQNQSTSTTNLVEILTAEVIARHFPQRFDYDIPAVVLEHYEEPALPRDRVGPRTFDYDQVVFSSWRPGPVFLGGKRRVSLGIPDWKPMTPEKLVEITGKKIAQEIVREGQPHE